MVFDNALELTDVTSGYGENIVVRSVSLAVPKSSVLALLGPNGVGKSTLLRTISGLVDTRQGEVHLNGENVTKLPVHARARRGLCLIPEGRGIYPGLSVEDNLRMQSPFRGKEAVEIATTAFPVLGRRLGQRAGSLSGGEQQMLSMVAGYVRNPTVLLVDEPSLGLAPQVVDAIFGFLESIAKRGVALVIVDQFVHIALNLADMVCVMNQGEIVLRGKASELSESDVYHAYVELSGTIATSRGV